MEEPKYIHWLIKENTFLNDTDHEIQCFNLDYNNDEQILNDWAKHIRNHYISDKELSLESNNLGMSKSDYLKQYIIPDCCERLGSTSQSNVFSEIIFSDLLQFIFNYKVPRYRQYCMSGKTVSEHGTDIIAYKIINSNKEPDSNDILLACEVKALLSKGDLSVITNSLKDLNKDIEHRSAISLDYAKRKLKLMGKYDEADDILRFQKQTVLGYECKTVFVAAGITSIDKLDDSELNKYKIIKIDQEGFVSLIAGKEIFFIHGSKLLNLAHDLFERTVKNEL